MSFENGTGVADLSVLQNKTHKPRALLTCSCFLLFDFAETGVAVVFPLSVLTVVLNSLVIITIWKDPLKNLKGIPSFLILNLAVSDFLVGIPGMLLYVLSYWFPNESQWLKKASDITLHLVYYASCISILALAVERLIVISFPLRSADYLTYTRLTLGIFCIWLFAGLLAFLPLNAGDSFDCYGVIIHDALFFLIIISLFACYGRIFFLVRKALYRNLTAEAWYERQSLTENGRKREKIKRSERTVAFSVFILVGVFVVCWTPVIVLENLTELCRNYMNSTNFHMALDTLPMLHPLANPIAYALCTVKFRRALWRIFCRR